MRISINDACDWPRKKLGQIKLFVGPKPRIEWLTNILMFLLLILTKDVDYYSRWYNNLT